ncbi:hypothetical protein JCM17380_34130 [Desulfosporosinus burensis]
MGSLTHKNLPFSMFLETPDLGFTAYSGATDQSQSNDTIIAELGLQGNRKLDNGDIVAGT